ncbi:hypothetical protein, partial [Pseudomonas viridiflava]|uniref:hypothetical protein n=1 Tax=Pseudomonas viridiflava TaxID=33069 RepID=UPI00197DF408
LSVQQRRNADLVAKLIDKADEECPAFIFNQAPHESNAKSLCSCMGLNTRRTTATDKARHECG